MTTPNQPIPSWEEQQIIEVVERIVIDYANFSGREDVHRAEFRTRTLERLTKLLTTAHTEWREQAKKQINEKISHADKCNYRPCACGGEGVGRQTVSQITSLPFLQPPKDTPQPCSHAYEKESHTCIKCGKKDGFSRWCGSDYCQCAS